MAIGESSSRSLVSGLGAADILDRRALELLGDNEGEREAIKSLESDFAD